jgi:hypothetical protein
MRAIMMMIIIIVNSIVVMTVTPSQTELQYNSRQLALQLFRLIVRHGTPVVKLKLTVIVAGTLDRWQRLPVLL